MVPTGRRIVLVTNVRQPVLEAYVAPLADLPDVAEIVLIRDHLDVDLGPKVRVAAPLQRVRSLRIPARWRLFVRETRRCAPHLLMTLHWFPDGPIVARYARMLGIPTVANIIGGRAELLDGGRRLALSSLPRWSKRWAERFQRRWLNRTTAITFTGHATETWFRSAGVTQPFLLVLHSAIRAPAELPTPGSRPTDVAYVGRVHPDKRVDRLFSVLAAVAEQRPGTTAVIIGISEAEASRFQSYHVARAIFESRLQLRAYVARVEDVLLRTKVLVVPSDTEGKSLAVLEAMACGAVPVVTDVGDLREAVQDGAAGISITLEHDENQLVSRLAHAVTGLLEDQARRTELGKRGRASVLRDHDRTRAMEDWRRVLDLALG